MSNGTAERLVHALYAAYNAREAETAAALYEADGRHEEVASGRVSTGRVAIRDGLERFFHAFPDVHWEPRSLIAQGDAAAVTYVLTGTLSAQLGPFAPRGQRLELRGVHVVRARAALIEVSEDYWDATTFGGQMAPAQASETPH